MVKIIFLARRVNEMKNPIAKLLSNPMFRKKVTKDESKYNRKRDKKDEERKIWSSKSKFTKE